MKRPAECGTFSGYKRHRRSHEEACERCLAATRDYNRDHRSPRPSWEMPDWWKLRNRKEAESEVVAAARARGVVLATDPLDLFGRTDDTAGLYDRASLMLEHIHEAPARYAAAKLAERARRRADGVLASAALEMVETARAAALASRRPEPTRGYRA